MTTGLARRFAAYKRPNLLLQDPDRLVRLLSNRERPVQLVLAGKAHPADQTGQDLIKAWIQFTRLTDVRGQWDSRLTSEPLEPRRKSRSAPVSAWRTWST